MIAHYEVTERQLEPGGTVWFAIVAVMNDGCRRILYDTIRRDWAEADAQKWADRRGVGFKR